MCPFYLPLTALETNNKIAYYLNKIQGTLLGFTVTVRGRHSRDHMVVGFTTVKSMSITTTVVSSNPVHGEVYSIQYYVIKLVSDLHGALSR